MLVLLLKGKTHTSALRPASDEPLLPGATDGIQETGLGEPVSHPGPCDLCTHRTVAMVMGPDDGPRANICIPTQPRAIAHFHRLIPAKAGVSPATWPKIPGRYSRQQQMTGSHAWQAAGFFLSAWRNVSGPCYKGWRGTRRTEMTGTGTVFDANSLYLISRCDAADS